MWVLCLFQSLAIRLHPVIFDGILDGMRKNENISYRQKPLKAMSDNGLRGLQPQSKQARQVKPSRFLTDHDGSLYIKLGHRAVTLTPSEVTELHNFLNSTQAVNLSEV